MGLTHRETSMELGYRPKDAQQWNKVVIDLIRQTGHSQPTVHSKLYRSTMLDVALEPDEF